MKELLRRVQSDKSDETAKHMANIMYETATLRSGFMLQDTANFAKRVEVLLRKSLGVSEDAQVEDEPEVMEDVEEEQKPEDEVDEEQTDHDEL